MKAIIIIVLVVAGWHVADSFDKYRQEKKQEERQRAEFNYAWHQADQELTRVAIETLRTELVRAETATEKRFRLRNEDLHPIALNSRFNRLVQKNALFPGDSFGEIRQDAEEALSAIELILEVMSEYHGEKPGERYDTLSSIDLNTSQERAHARFLRIWGPIQEAVRDLRYASVTSQVTAVKIPKVYLGDEPEAK